MASSQGFFIFFFYFLIFLTGQFISRDEYRTKKALDDLRKAGKMPAELDEEGKEINPHLPQYIIQAPCMSFF